MGTLSIWGRSQQVGFECTDSYEPAFEGLQIFIASFLVEGSQMIGFVIASLTVVPLVLVFVELLFLICTR